MNLLWTLCVTLIGAGLAAQRQPLGDGRRSVDLYDVRDLLAAAAPAPADGLPLPRHSGELATAPLAELVRAFLPPPAVAEKDVSVVGDSHLVAAATSEQQAWIGRFLQHARRELQTPIQVEARTLAIPLRLFDAEVLPVLRQAASDAGGQGEPTTAVLGPGPAADAFLARLRRGDGVVELQAPRIAALPLQRVTLFVGEQRSYIRDFTLEMQGGQAIANPVVDVVEDGARLQCAAATLEDGGVGVVLAASIAQVDLPMAEVKAKLPGGVADATIQLPRQRLARLRAALALPPGHFALLALPAIGEHRFLMVVRAERLVAPFERKPEPAADGERRTWIYDLADLMEPSAGAGDTGDALPAELLRCAALARRFLEPPLASDEKVTAAGPHHLVLTGSTAQHRWLEAFVAAQRARGAPEWTVQPELVLVPAAAYEQHVLPMLRRLGLRADAGHGGEQASLAPGTDLDAVVAAVRGQPAATVVALPPATLRRLQEGVSSALEHTSYVRDFEVQTVGGEPVAKPVEDVVRHGPLLECAVAALPDGKVGVSVDATLMHLLRPIPKFTTAVLGNAVELDLPRVSLVRASAALALSPDGLGILSMPAAGGGAQAVVLVRLVTPGSAR